VPNKPRVIISYGGSILVPGPLNGGSSWIDQKALSSLTLLLHELAAKYRFVVTVGGGKINSHYVEILRKMHGQTPIKDRLLDLLGISATHFNATLLWVPLCQAGLAYREVVANPTIPIRTTKPIIIGCGWKPGCSTDLDAVLWAISVGAKVVINASNISHVYTADPRTDKTARPLKALPWDELLKITGKKWSPRMNVPFDPIAAIKARDNHITVKVLDGRNMANLRSAITGEEFTGTTIG